MRAAINHVGRKLIHRFQGGPKLRQDAKGDRFSGPQSKRWLERHYNRLESIEWEACKVSDAVKRVPKPGVGRGNQIKLLPM